MNESRTIKLSLISATLFSIAVLVFTLFIGLDANARTRTVTASPEQTGVLLEKTLFLYEEYKGDKLIKIKLYNTGYPLKVTVLNEDYYLGKGDSVEIDPPNFEHMFIRVIPLTDKNMIRPLLTSGLERTYLLQIQSPNNNKSEE